MIAAAPIDANAPLESVYTGKELIVWGSHRGDGAGTGAAYDPASDSWRTIPDPPIGLSDANTVWTGKEVVVFGADLRAGNRATTEFAVGAAYDPAANSWREIAPSELSPQASDVVWDGSQMVAADYLLGVAGYDPVGDAWTPLPRLPTNACEGYPELTRVGAQVIASFCGELVSRESGEELWHVILGRGAPGPFDGGWYSTDLVEAGDVLLAFRDYPPKDAGALVAYRPPQIVTSKPTAADAWDVAAAFAALRSHYPYDPAHVPEQVLDQVAPILSSQGAHVWESRSGGLRALWAYYTGFEVVSVESRHGPDGNARFEVVVSLSPYPGGEHDYRELLSLAPGTGMDEEPHDLVIVDARADL